MFKRGQLEKATPLVRWLMEYSMEHEITLTELARKANLSQGTLRTLVKYPDRVPALETCIKLAKVTDKSPEEISQMAGLKGIPLVDSDPNFATLVEIYKNLPPEKQVAWIKIGQVLNIY